MTGTKKRLKMLRYGTIVYVMVCILNLFFPDTKFLILLLILTGGITLYLLWLCDTEEGKDESN